MFPLLVRWLGSVVRRRGANRRALRPLSAASEPGAGRLLLRYRHRAGVVTESVNDGLILVDLDRGVTFRLNRTGRATWELLGRQRTPAEIVEHMHRAWNVAADQLKCDVTALLTELLNNHLIDPEGVCEPRN